MDQYELQSTSSDAPNETGEIVAAHGNRNELTTLDDKRSPGHPNKVDPVLRTLVMLQRQQSEQTQLLRQVLQELATLKTTQNQQGSTVTKLDRRLRWARVWRLSWWLTRLLMFGAGIWFLLYLIGIEQIQAMWERLLWLLT